MRQVFHFYFSFKSLKFCLILRCCKTLWYTIAWLIATNSSEDLVKLLVENTTAISDEVEKTVLKSVLI